MTLLTELKRRNVIRMAGLYLVGAWLAVQVAGTVLPMFEAPAWLARGIVVLLVIGFLPAMAVSWVFELTPGGLKRESDVSPEQSIAPRTARRIDRLIVAGLLAVIVLMAAERVFNRAAPVSDTTTASGARVVTPAPADVSIAVLPLTNLSGDPAQEYFSDGMSEELLDGLSRVGGLRVAARTSSFQFKGRNSDIQEIAKRLGVSTVLEGSLRKSGNRVRITTQLIDGATGFRLWSESYDRELDDIFALQDEISAQVVAQLRTRLGLAAAAGATSPTRVTNAAAYDAYLRGREGLREGEPESITRALAELESATRLDPEYAPAWASLAEAIMLSRRTTTGLGIIPVDEASDRTRAALATARRLNPELADVYAMEAMFQQFNEGQLTAALAAADAAIARNPSHAQALSQRADLLNRFGRYRESLQQSLELARVDPLFARNNVEIVRKLALFGRWAEAAPYIERIGSASARASQRSHEFNYEGEWDRALLAQMLDSKGLLQWYGSREHLAVQLCLLGLFDDCLELSPPDEHDIPLAMRGDWAGAVAHWRGAALPPFKLDPTNFDSYRHAEQSYRTGDAAGSLVKFEHVTRVWPYGLADDWIYRTPRRIWHALALRDAGRLEDARRVEDVTRADVEAARRDGIDTPLVDLLSAEVALWDGRPEQALPRLARGLRAEPYLSTIESDPAYAAVRDDAAFKAIVAGERARRDTMRASFLKQACAFPADADWRPLPASCKA